MPPQGKHAEDALTVPCCERAATGVPPRIHSSSLGAPVPAKASVIRRKLLVAVGRLAQTIQEVQEEVCNRSAFALPPLGSANQDETSG